MTSSAIGQGQPCQQGEREGGGRER
jgi:hypothetical protein